MAKLSVYKNSSGTLTPIRVTSAKIKRIGARGMDTMEFEYPKTEPISDGDNVQAYLYDNRNGLVGYWKFDEMSGLVAHDDSGNGNDGILVNGPTWVSGKFGGALSFNGVNSFVQVNLNNLVPKLTIAGWYKTTSTTGTTFSITTNYLSNTATQIDIGIWNGVLNANLYTTTNNFLGDSITTNDGNWHQFALSYDGSTAKLYRDGNLVATLSLSYSYSAWQQIIIGVGEGQGNGVWNGLIDDVRIYNRALSASEIQELYLWGKKNLLDPQSLVGYWTFDEKSGIVAYDSSGHGNHGTLVNSPARVVGKWGGAISFNGINQYVQSSISQVATQFSLVGWYNATIGTIVGITTNSNSGTAPQVDVGISGGYLTANVFTTVQNAIQDTVASNDGKWHQFGLTYDGQTAKLYRDGGVVGSLALSYSYGQWQQMVVGVGEGQGYSYLSGSVDDVRFYQRVLDDNEVQYLYQNPPSSVTGNSTKLFDGTVEAREYEQYVVKATAYSKRQFAAENWLEPQKYYNNTADVIIKDLVLRQTPLGWANGITSQSLSFDGSSGYVTIPDSESLDMTGGITLDVWVNPNNIGNSPYVVYKGNQYYLQIASNGQAVFGVYVGGAWRTVNSGSYTLTTGSWANVIGSYDGANLRIYLNGVLVNQVSLSGSIGTSTNALTVGLGSGVYFNGKIGHIRMWNRGLSTAEVLNLWRGFHISNGLVGWWMESGVDTTANVWKDYSPYNNQGQLVGGVSVASTDTVLGQLVAKGYLLDLINNLTLADSADYYEDAYGALHYVLNPTDSQRVFLVGVNCRADKLARDDTQFYNEILLEGGKQAFSNVETATGNGSQTVFSVQYPFTTIAVKVNGTLKTAFTDYTADNEKATITFATAPANGASIEFDYIYEVPVTARVVDLNSQAQYGRRQLEIGNDSIKTFKDAQLAAQALLSVYDQFVWQGDVVVGGVQTNIADHQLVTLIDNYRGIQSSVMIKEIDWTYPDGTTTFSVGTYLPVLYDWQKDVLKKLNDLSAKMGVTGVLTRTIAQSESISSSDTQNVSTANSGSFIYDTAQYELSDYA